MADTHRKRTLLDAGSSLARPLKAATRGAASDAPVLQSVPDKAESASCSDAPAEPATPEPQPPHAVRPAPTGGSGRSDSNPRPPAQQPAAATAATQPAAASCDCGSPTSPATPRSEQQSAFLLLKACEREEAAEERAEGAEAELAASNRRLASVEAELAAAQERVKMLEVQLLNRAVAASRLDGSKPSSHSSDQALSEASEASASEMAGEDWPPRRSVASFDWDHTQLDSEAVQLRLDLESAQARLQLSRETEQKAAAFADASGRRMDAFAEMLRGAADIAFAGSDCSARRLRHHLFRCLDVDCDGFLGGHDLQHWYQVSEQFLDTQGHGAVEYKAIQAQLADALFNPCLPPEFQCQGKVSLMQLSRSKMGAGMLATLLNLDNMMQDRSSSEWGSPRAVALS